MALARRRPRLQASGGRLDLEKALEFSSSALHRVYSRRDADGLRWRLRQGAGVVLGKHISVEDIRGETQGAQGVILFLLNHPFLQRHQEWSHHVELVGV